jgi:hypothetical protein
MSGKVCRARVEIYDGDELFGQLVQVEYNCSSGADVAEAVRRALAPCLRKLKLPPDVLPFAPKLLAPLAASRQAVG